MSDNAGVRIITRRLHGSHAVVDQAKDLQAALQEGARPLSEDVQDNGLREATGEAALESVGATDFDYLFPELPREGANLLPTDTAQVTLALDALGTAMIDQGDSGRNAPIPPIHTYWGQFVDHDLTAATDNDSPISIQGDSVVVVGPDEVTEQLKNGRNPALNLDSVYGNGPFAPAPSSPKEIVVPYQESDRTKLKIGSLSPAGGAVGVLIPPVADLQRDLPRVEVEVPNGLDLGTPLIGDGRNDENLVVAQLHLAFLRFHNNAVDWVRDHEAERTGVSEVFNRARQLVQWTYQWICVHDYLNTVLTPGTVDEVLASEEGLLKRPFMPLEFSVAAFRFGHSMVRGAYDWNRNFGLGGFFQPVADLDTLFRFTGRGGMAGDPTKLPDNWPAEYDRLVRLDPAFPTRFARPIDTHLADPLKDMVNQVPDTDPAPSPPVADLLKHLARRNLRRGYALSIPTGQAVAARLGLPVLQEQDFADALDQTVFHALEAGGFLSATPLWFYVLAESEVRSNGHALGPVGSRIVAETIIGQIRLDPRSYMNQTAWTPAAGVKLPDGSAVTSIAKFIQFAGFPV
ncbi:peroxidase family protein [Actinomycetospora straminea]|uniref:Heme peroxidase family protein n=1 Tax=Actinomycetospora straminea TaxID=663607 RepID=A0ABP9DWY9_9PSEU|nr:heme peroxidase family protein [Actinomycetospora straminea]MDD7934140.1 heme peroxidase family protein [Actinomycetospora straminea]